MEIVPRWGIYGRFCSAQPATSANTSPQQDNNIGKHVGEAGKKVGRPGPASLLLVKPSL